jgi:methionyl-tRNA formyltransferase
MTIFFAGTPEFAVPSLTAVAARFPVVGVLTQADAGQGRGRKPAPSPVKVKARELGLPVFEPGKIDRAFRETVSGLAPRLLLCVAIGRIFGPKFLALFPDGGINVHPSLLPRFRGPSPIPAAILSGDAVTGVTVQRLALKTDTGDILAQAVHPIAAADTTASLSPRLARLGAALCVETIEAIAAGTARSTPQDESKATSCRLLSKEDGLLDFRLGAAELERAVRAYNPWPLAHAFWNGKRLFFLAGAVHPAPPPTPSPPPGAVLGMDKERGILINTGNGILAITLIQLEYKKPLPFRDFLNGNRDLIGSVLSGAGGGESAGDNGGT